MTLFRTRGGGRRLRLSALVLAIAAITAGCSMIRLGYSQLDHYAAWKADEYFDLESSQKEAFMAAFHRLQQWHRQAELPRYAAVLEETSTRFERSLEQKDVLWLVETAQARYRVVVERAAGDAAALLLTITPPQIEALKRQWTRDNARFTREHALNGTAKERLRLSLRRNLDRIRHWTGPLSREQEGRVADLLAAVPDIGRMRYEDRLRRQREFLQLMAERDNPVVFTERLRDWLLHWEQGRDPAYERRMQQFTAMRAQMVVEIAHTLSPRQRNHVRARLGDYIEDIHAMTERGGERPRRR